MKIQEGPFSLDSERDADIVALYESAENKSALFRLTARAHITDQVSLAEDIAEIKAMLKAGIVIKANDPEQEQSNGLLEQAMSKLDNIGVS